jgi:hypothetical protein
VCAAGGEERAAGRIDDASKAADAPPTPPCAQAAEERAAGAGDAAGGREGGAGATWLRPRQRADPRLDAPPRPRSAAASTSGAGASLHEGLGGAGGRLGGMAAEPAQAPTGGGKDSL